MSTLRDRVNKYISLLCLMYTHKYTYIQNKIREGLKLCIPKDKHDFISDK